MILGYRCGLGGRQLCDIPSEPTLNIRATNINQRKKQRLTSFNFGRLQSIDVRGYIYVWYLQLYRWLN